MRRTTVLGDSASNELDERLIREMRNGRRGEEREAQGMVLVCVMSAQKVVAIPPARDATLGRAMYRVDASRRVSPPKTPHQGSYLKLAAVDFLAWANVNTCSVLPLSFKTQSIYTSHLEIYLLDA